MAKRSKRKKSMRRENEEITKNIDSKLENKIDSNNQEQAKEVVIPENENTKKEQKADNSIDIAKKELEKQVWEWVDKEIEKEKTEKKNRENHDFITTFHRKDTDEDFGLDTPRAKKLIEEEEKRKAKEKQEVEAEKAQAKEEYLKEVSRVHETVSKFHSKDTDDTLVDPESIGYIKRISKEEKNTTKKEESVENINNTTTATTESKLNSAVKENNEDTSTIITDNHKNEENNQDKVLSSTKKANELTDEQEKLIDEFRKLCYDIQNANEELTKSKLRKKLLEKVAEMNSAGIDMKMSDVANLISQGNDKELNKVVKLSDSVIETKNTDGLDNMNNSSKNEKEKDTITIMPQITPENSIDEDSIIPPFDPSFTEENGIDQNVGTDTYVPEDVESEEGIKIKFSAETGKYVLTNNGTPLYRVDAKDVLKYVLMMQFLMMKLELHKLTTQSV